MLLSCLKYLATPSSPAPRLVRIRFLKLLLKFLVLDGPFTT